MDGWPLSPQTTRGTLYWIEVALVCVLYDRDEEVTTICSALATKRALNRSRG